MFIQKLILNNFKNNEDSAIFFDKKCTVFVGKNGVGKTNILEAIYYLSVFKSYFGLPDKDLILSTSQHFFLSCNFIIKDEKKQLICGYKLGEKKNIKINNKKYEKISEHIGKFPVVFLTPYDIDLVREGSEQRRKFFDLIISTNSSEYLNNLLEYNKILEQRNRYLKQVKEYHNFDKTLINTYNEKLSELGEKIFEERKKFITEFVGIFKKYYSEMSNVSEIADIDYSSQLSNNRFSELLDGSLEKDLLLERTTCGIHKDDYLFKINSKECNKFASQGQLKSFVIALKLAQYKIVFDKLNIKPVTLLDDIFDRLDAFRSKKLMEIIDSDFFGQIIITDTDSIRILKHFESTDNLTIFKVDNGKINLEK
jgi:DNA replication and repair protein RecF